MLMSRSSATNSDSGHIARKRFGQNFLRDSHYIARIVGLIDPKPAERLVEIGPGQGALTAPLISACGHLHAIEIDRDLAAGLRARFPSEALSLQEKDVLRVDFLALAQALGGPLRIVGNLPYNISSPILFHLLEAIDVIVDQHVMLQKEVVDRMTASCGSKTYGRLTVMLAARYRMERCLVVPPGAFYPVPQVDSAIVRMVPIAKDKIRILDGPLFASVVSLAFSQRRKMLRNTLSTYADRIDWQALGIAPTDRAEDVSVDQFVDLANQIRALSA